MEKHSCKTYFAVLFKFDIKKNIALLKERDDCLPEEIGILNRNEVEKFIADMFGVKPEWNRHHFVIGFNDDYDVDVNAMLRVTLKDLLGKEDKVKEMCGRFGVTASLEIVPQIAANSEEPKQILSLDKDMTDFLYLSGTLMDLDYYVI